MTILGKVKTKINYLQRHIAIIRKTFIDFHGLNVFFYGQITNFCFKNNDMHLLKLNAIFKYLDNILLSFAGLARDFTNK